MRKLFSLPHKRWGRFDLRVPLILKTKTERDLFPVSTSRFNQRQTNRGTVVKGMGIVKKGKVKWKNTYGSWLS